MHSRTRSPCHESALAGFSVGMLAAVGSVVALQLLSDEENVTFGRIYTAAAIVILAVLYTWGMCNTTGVLAAIAMVTVTVATQGVEIARMAKALKDGGALKDLDASNGPIQQ
jgi:NhaP-type Na+/H+ or K+/H+ antiporter